MDLPCARVPSDPLACQIFTYNGKIVALNLVGGVIPIVVSVVFTSFLISKSKNKFNPSQVIVYFGMTSFIGLAIASFYQIYDNLHGGITSNLGVPAALPVLGAIAPVAILQAVFLERKNLKPVDLSNLRTIVPPIRNALLKSYIMGTFGVILSDIFRIFGFPGIIVALNVSPDIIGAYQYEDGVFQDGFFLALFCLLSIICIYVYSKPLKLPRDLRSNGAQ
jgi:hypothetical protein